MTSSITQIANIKDVYNGTVFADTGTYGQITFNSYFSSSSFIDLGCLGSDYIITMNVKCQLFANTSYVAAFSCTQDYRFIPSLSNFSSLNYSTTPRNLSYTNYITEVIMGPISDFGQPPYVAFKAYGSYTWAYNLWVDGELSRVYTP